MVHKVCDGGFINTYSTLLEAQNACSHDSTCQCIYDTKCDGNRFIPSKGDNVRTSSQGSCAWIKDTGRFLGRA